MDLAEIDKNFAICDRVEQKDVVWLNPLFMPLELYGVFFDEKEGLYRRMPAEPALDTCREVWGLSRHTAGGRVRFRTDSPYIAIRCYTKNEYVMGHMALTGQSGFDLYADRGEGYRYEHSFIPPAHIKEGYSSCVDVRQTGMADYEINMPLYDQVHQLFIGVKEGSHFEKARDYAHQKPVVYYGSSITQGGCASRPGNSYQGFLSRWLDTDYINLGFSGNGRAQPAMVAYLAHLDMSVFVCDYDHNAPDFDYLKKTHWPLYEAVRKAQPELPIIFLSAPDVRINPGKFEARRALIREDYEKARALGDTHVYYVDGYDLYEGIGWDDCTVDGCHPNDLGFFRMASAIAPVLRPLLK